MAKTIRCVSIPECNKVLIIQNATVPAFNSCTKCVGRPVKIHARTTNPVSWAGMRLQVRDLTTESNFD